MKRKAVFIVQEWSRAGGLEIVTQDFVGVFRKLGYDVTVFATIGVGEDIEEPGFKVKFCVPRNRLLRAIWCRWLKYRQLGRAVTKTLSPGDVLVVAHAYLLDVFKYAKLPADVTRWLWTHGVDAWAWRVGNIVKWQHELTRVIAVSNYTAEQERSNGVTIPISVIANNADVSRFTPTDTPERIRRREILISCRLTMHTRNKGHDVLFAAIPLVEERLGAEVRVRVIGTGSDVEHVKGLAARLCPGRVDFLGRVTDEVLLESYQHCAVFCMPSRVEFDEAANDIRGDGFGLVYVEAQACGRPVVGSTEGGATETINEGVTGYKVNPRDVHAVADALVKILSDVDKADEMGQAARDFAVRKFSHEAFVRRIMEVLQEDA